MIVHRRIGFVLVALLLGATAVLAAELPSQRHSDKPTQAEAAKKCNIAGSPGVLAGNGVCVRLSGYVTSQFGSQLK
jgi:multisubunit Na+/H+ antiporter MnhG subunit